MQTALKTAHDTKEHLWVLLGIRKVYPNYEKSMQQLLFSCHIEGLRKLLDMPGEVIDKIKQFFFLT